MVEAGEGPKAALLRAACSWDIRGRGESSQALTLGHRRRTVTLPDKLKRGGIINKSAFMGLHVKEAATERNRSASAWSPASKGCGSPRGRRMGREKRGSTVRKGLFVRSYMAGSHWEITRLSVKRSRQPSAPGRRLSCPSALWSHISLVPAEGPDAHRDGSDVPAS